MPGILRFLLSAALVVPAGLLAEPSDEAAPSESAVPEIEYILFITADGFRTDYMEWYEPPVLTELMEGGTRVLDARSVFPSNTTPNMTSLVTGAYPRTTGVANNTQFDRQLDRFVSGPRAQGTPTIAGMLAQANWRVAAVSHFALETRGVPQHMYFQVETYSLDPAATAAVADKAIELLEEDVADFIAVNFGATDTVGHRHGPHSAEIEEMVLAVDAQVGRIIQALKDRGIHEKTLITFNSDHGMSEFEDSQASMEPAAALRQAGFNVATNQGELDADTDIVVIATGVRFIYFRRELSGEEMQRAMAALETIEGVEIYGRGKLDELHCHPELSGDLIVHPLPGHAISGAGNSGGLHGRKTESNPVLLLHGPGIRRGATVARAENVDIVPTLLHLVGVNPTPTVDGSVVRGVLANQPTAWAVD